jgi:hypothetical protein
VEIHNRPVLERLRLMDISSRADNGGMAAALRELLVVMRG